MRLRMILLAGLAVAIPGCQSKEPSGAGSSEGTNGPDTILVVHKADKSWRVQIPKVDRAYFNGLQALVDTVRPSADSGWTVFSADITGEGTPQRCVSTWKLNDSGAVLRRFVISRQGVIWRDSLALSDEHAYFQAWDQDSSYYAMKPYSTAFVAAKELEGFIGDSVGQSVLEDGPARDYLLKFHPLTYWRDYLSHFKGRAINTLGMEPRSFIWDKQIRKFILLFKS